MARNRRNNMYDIATKKNKPGGISNVPGGGETRDPTWWIETPMDPSIAGEYQEQMGAPQWGGVGNYLFGGGPGAGLYGPNSEWAESFDTWFPGWEINSFGDFMDWWSNAPGAPGSGMDFMGNEVPSDQEFGNYTLDWWYDWYLNASQNWAEPTFGSGGTNIGGIAGDLSEGSNFAGSEGPQLDCDFLGPQYDNDGICYACCGGEIVDECADGPIFDDSGNCIDCCGTMPILNQDNSIY
tara:strand:+ start:1105 stop:1818 length:714 start_codon:yes stop_codon:yes gene_type:complete